MRPPLPHPPPQWVKPATADTTLEYDVELITPMFGGGVTPHYVDENMPIRAREVRGQLRFWWRLLARCGVFGNERQTNHRDEEQTLWGMAAEEDTTPGLIDVRVVCNPARPESYGRYDEGRANRNEPRYVPDPWLAPRSRREGIDKEFDEGLNYILFACKGELSSRDRTGTRKKVRDPDSYLKPPYSFTLRLILDTRAPVPEIQRAVCWWAAFGGIGLRTRRGAGAVAVSLGGAPLTPPSPTEV